MASELDRLEVARLVHRFGFGPKPTEFERLLDAGVAAARDAVLKHGVVDPGARSVPEPNLPNMGQAPQSPNSAVQAYWQEVWDQSIEVAMWWLDLMVAVDYPLVERMTWFWHGHWATSIQKVSFALPMKRQNDTLRQHALGNFADMSRSMVLDGAMIFWLDGEVNVAEAPNENLAREFMELFTLGVGNYSQNDVAAAAKGLTGYQVVQTTGAVSFDNQYHYTKPVTLLGERRSFTAPSISDHVVSLEENARYIARRLWYRFVSSSVPAPSVLAQSFAGRNIWELVATTASHPAMRHRAYSQAKSPVEWFVSACRALSVRPSRLPKDNPISWYLGLLGQFPFNPPNVGGWPADEAWLTAAAVQYRFQVAYYLVQYADLAPIKDATGDVMTAAANWLGVAKWSERTIRSLAQALKDPAQFAVVALCAPEYVVNA